MEEEEEEREDVETRGCKKKQLEWKKRELWNTSTGKNDKEE